MAVSIMSTPRSLLFLCCFLQVQGQVFQAPRTHDIFLRSKRANMYLVEEILQGNLERECYEELCNFEEAREYFEDTPKTMAFWTVYIDGDQCKPNPCLNGGNCTDKVGGFHCSCPATHHGQVCEWTAGQPEPITKPPKEFFECPTSGPTACDQHCTVSYHSFTCSCMSGFKLQTDGRTCQPEVEFPCGRFPDESSSTASICHHGNCPWQVLLLNSKGEELCSGVILGRFSVLTAARCLFPGHLYLQPFKLYVIPGNTRAPIPVQALYVHDRFHPDRNDNDLAILELARPLTFGPDVIQLCLPNKDFCENILMHSGRTGIIKRRGLGQTQNLVYMTLNECRQELEVSHPLSNKMFCMKPQSRAIGRSHGGPPTTPSPLNHTSASDQNRTSPHRAEHSGTKSGGLLPGTPVATVDRGTVFVTGLMMSSSTEGGGLVFTKLSRYLSWIKPRMETAEAHTTPQVKLYPEHR
ncbi:uncharacterized protein V6R79_025864 [Siganus canaliculatus]